jgi:hypothetical protein
MAYQNPNHIIEHNAMIALELDILPASVFQIQLNVPIPTVIPKIVQSSKPLLPVTFK